MAARHMSFVVRSGDTMKDDIASPKVSSFVGEGEAEDAVIFAF